MVLLENGIRFCLGESMDWRNLIKWKIIITGTMQVQRVRFIQKTSIIFAQIADHILALNKTGAMDSALTVPGNIKFIGRRD